MAPRAERPPTISATYLSERSGEESTPDLRILHYNDVYHVDEASSEPVGGLARFITLCKEYKESPKFEGQPEPLVFFSGDAFNPSLESSVTKGVWRPLNTGHDTFISDVKHLRTTHGPSPERYWD